MQQRSVLQSALSRWCADGALYAVVDGAGYDDLPAQLKNAGLVAGSLFREPCDPEIMRSSPFLVKVTAAHLEALLSLPELDKNAVFWRAPASTGHIFWRHLRTLTMMRIPSAADDGTGRNMRRAVFRHQDPDVMARMLPILRPAQRARLFGPAQMLLLALPDGLKEAQRQSEWPAAERGLLTLTPLQLQALERSSHERTLLEIAAFLRETAPDETTRLGHKGMEALIRHEEARGRTWGLESPRHLGMFCWLALTSGEAFVMDPDVRAYVQSGDADSARKSPDERMTLLIDEMHRQNLLATFKT